MNETLKDNSMNEIQKEYWKEIGRVKEIFNVLEKKLKHAESVCAYIEDEKDKIESYLEFLEEGGKLGDYRPL